MVRLLFKLQEIGHNGEIPVYFHTNSNSSVIHPGPLTPYTENRSPVVLGGTLKVTGSGHTRYTSVLWDEKSELRTRNPRNGFDFTLGTTTHGSEGVT